MKLPRALFALFFSLFASTFVLEAQTDEAPTIRAEFSVYSLKRPDDLKFINGDRKTANPITFYSSSRSPKYIYEGTNPIIFFKESPAPTETNPNAVRRHKVAEISLPEPRGEYLFIFFPIDGAEEESYRIYPLDDSSSTFPFGSIRLFNATSFTLEGLLGRERLRLKPGPSKAYRIDSSRVSLGLGFRHEGQFHQSFNSPLQMESGSRGLMMIFPPFVKGSAIVQTRFIRENAPDERDDVPLNTKETNSIEN